MTRTQAALSKFDQVYGQTNEAGESLWDIVMVTRVECDDWPVVAEKLTFDEAVQKMKLLGVEHGLAKVFLWPHWAYACDLNDEVHMQIERAEFNRYQQTIDTRKKGGKR